jgi:hypothetical protein
MLLGAESLRERPLTHWMKELGRTRSDLGPREFDISEVEVSQLVL